eukprot:TRINITY_DN24925_c0_g1_i1.p1 TRINITY_DN24925_c0_g1~~TRINITY_DN24925_c0_g1_i1.p1  ORF type:complete len:221 (-),score=38.31 TRINITY_DN24925_c0_g1_i1:142-804(-)
MASPSSNELGAVLAPTFMRASSGQWMLAAEPAPEFIPRGLMVLLVLVQGIAVIAFTLLHRARLQPTPASTGGVSPAQCDRLLRSAFGWLLASMLFHTAHYADNIWDPVKYREPQWLYQAWLFTEMELTFAFFSPLCFVLLVSVDLLSAFPGLRPAHAKSAARTIWHLSLLHLAASALSGGHYALEAPPSFVLSANLTIMGELIASSWLAVEAWRLDRLFR